MDVKTKQRIIGGLVLLAVLAIVLPLLFYNFDTKPEKQSVAPAVQLQLPASTSVSDAAINSGSMGASTTQPMQATHTAETMPTTSEINTAQPISAASENVKPMQPLTAPPSHLDKPAATTNNMTLIHESADKTVSSSVAIQPQVLPSAEKMPSSSLSDLEQKSMRQAVAPVKPVKVSAHAAVKKSEKHLRNLHSPKAWVIQVGSFSERKNVRELMARLRSKGFNVYQRSEISHGKHVIRVFIGPEIKVAKIKQMQKQLLQQFKLKGIIHLYEV